MHPSLSYFPSKHFYDGRLVDGEQGGAGGGLGVFFVDEEEGGARGELGVFLVDDEEGGAGGGLGVFLVDGDQGGAGEGLGVFLVAVMSPGEGPPPSTVPSWVIYAYAVYQEVCSARMTSLLLLLLLCGISSSSSIGVQELLPIPPTVIRPGLGACNRCDRCL